MDQSLHLNTQQNTMKPRETLLPPRNTVEYVISNLRTEICLYFHCVPHDKELWTISHTLMHKVCLRFVLTAAQISMLLKTICIWPANKPWSKGFIMATLLQNTSAFHVKIDSNRNMPNNLHGIFGTSSFAIPVFAIQVLFYKFPSSTNVPLKKCSCNFEKMY